MSYQDKIETKLTDLQKEFFRLFRKSFPDLKDKIQIEQGIIHADNFCFSVTSLSSVFGKLSFDIGKREITVFSNFDHCHFGKHHFDEVKNEQAKNQFTSASAINYIKDFVNGDIIVEYEEADGIILRSSEYHKDEPTLPFSATVNLAEPKNKANCGTIVTKRVNWFGEID